MNSNITRLLCLANTEDFFAIFVIPLSIDWNSIVQGGPAVGIVIKSLHKTVLGLYGGRVG